jgi:alpha-beta hydrolase superfamily lysophospholipase
MPEFLGLQDRAELDAKLDEIRATDDAAELWAGHPYRMWKSYLDYLPLNDLSPLSIPMLLAQGDLDRAVPVESARALAESFTMLGKTNLTYVEYEGLDHHFLDAAGNSHMRELAHDAYAWMSEHGLLKPSR